MGAQKNRLIETVRLKPTTNVLLRNKKYNFQILTLIWRIGLLPMVADGRYTAHIVNPLGTFQEHPPIGKDDRIPSHLDYVDQD